MRIGHWIEDDATVVAHDGRAMFCLGRWGHRYEAILCREVRHRRPGSRVRILGRVEATEGRVVELERAELVSKKKRRAEVRKNVAWLREAVKAGKRRTPKPTKWVGPWPRSPEAAQAIAKALAFR